MNARNPGQGIIERVLVLAGRVDKRSIATVDGALADEAIAVREFLTSVDDIPVVGPGGRITFYTNQGGFTVDISVRRRTGRVDGNWSWRDPDLITAAWSRLSEGRLIESRIEFGYFEAGLHDVQLLLRPAYMFTATYQSTASRRGGWRTVIVEPATSARETSDDAGLETWFVEEI
jgi:hypothetical protein